MNEGIEAVDYNEFEYVAFSVLILLPGVVLVTTGISAHKRRSTSWMPRYLIVSILGCFLYAAFASGLLAKMVPPPYVPGLSEGRGAGPPGSGSGRWIVDRRSRRSGLCPADAPESRPHRQPPRQYAVHWPFSHWICKDDSRSRRDSKSNTYPHVDNPVENACSINYGDLP